MYERIYGIYDKVAEQIVKANVSLVMLYPNNQVAVRDFTEMAQDPRMPFNKYPNDYALVYLGQIDTTTGEINPAERMTEIVTAARILKPDKTQLELEPPPA